MKINMKWLSVLIPGYNFRYFTTHLEEFNDSGLLNECTVHGFLSGLSMFTEIGLLLTLIHILLK